MPAGQTNLLIEKGADFIKHLALRDKVTKVPTNISNCVVDFKVAAKQGGPTLFEINTAITDPLIGKFEATYSVADIELITIKEGWFTINITWSDGTTERLVEGRVVISKGVQ